jgi:hypothetical protein
MLVGWEAKIFLERTNGKGVWKRTLIVLDVREKKQKLLVKAVYND